MAKITDEAHGTDQHEFVMFGEAADIDFTWIYHCGVDSWSTVTFEIQRAVVYGKGVLGTTVSEDKLGKIRKIYGAMICDWVREEVGA